MLESMPLAQLILSHVRLYIREPEAIFWTYGFPVIMIVGLGLAFSNKSPDAIGFDIVSGEAADRIEEALSQDGRFRLSVHDREQAFERLRRNKTALVVTWTDGQYVYHFDPTNPESQAARATVHEALQRAAGRVDPIPGSDVEVTARGSRYVDFLVPGLIGMNIMGGGMWGIGFVLVDMRVKNLLKRLLATPMKRRDFLASLIGSRVVFFIPEVVFLMLAAWLVFDVPVAGSLAAILLIAFIGALSFAGLGLLTACRARRIESISGLMNVVMIPMWLCSGIFFSSERFPDFMQPFIQALPLTQLINALRALILDGDPFSSQLVPIVALLLWGTVSYALALKWFRWN